MGHLTYTTGYLPTVFFSFCIVEQLPMTFPTDRKNVVLWRYLELNSIRQTAKSCRVSKSTVQRWLVECTTPVPIPIKRNRIAIKQDRILPILKESLLKDPFKTCSSLASTLFVSKELVRRCFHKIGFSFKKARYYGVSKNGIQLENIFLARRDEYMKKGIPIYSVDETGFGRQSYQCRSGWSKKGNALRVVKQNARQSNVSVLACASSTGWVKRVSTTGSFNRSMFITFIQSLDVPVGSVILLDNASIHKGDDVWKACREKGIVLLYVPPYSPWYNPIEGCFSIVKRLYPKNQDINESFNNLTCNHFNAFFKKSLMTRGIDDTTSK